MTYFAFCVHNHQPVGNFGHVLEDAYEKAYWPFLKTLSGYPSIKLTLHNSGFLLDWVIKNRPEYIELLRLMVKAGQVEVMGGGHFEPILPVIPEGDRLAQIRMMSDRIEETFGVAPRGMWLPERVWEPELPSTLKAAGVEYVLVDDYHFVKAGLSREDLGGYYLTEDLGEAVKIFPGSEMLRYLIPFRPVERLEEHLSRLGGFLRKGNAAIYGDDGEKFGVWPGTHRWVYTEGWLKNFFEMLSSLDWLKPTTLGDYIGAAEPLGSVYLPTCSYMEMGEWTLPAEASAEYMGLVEELKEKREGARIARFLQGGTWRYFFAKYPESNWMHKRMLLASRTIADRREKGMDTSRASRALYMAQCNDAYWHGIFGGLYLPHLRAAVYGNLIEAEEAVGDGRFSMLKADMDADGSEEVIIREGDLGLFLSTGNGGGLYELDFRPGRINLLNVLSRWPEGYHHKLERRGTGGGEGAKSIHELVISKEEDIKKYLRIDRLRRGSFLDHFLPPGETLPAFSSGSHTERGDFHTGRYAAELRERGVLLSRKGSVGGRPVAISKEIRVLDRSAFSVRYHLEGDELRGLNFGVELNLILPACDGPAASYGFHPPVPDDTGLGSTGAVEALERLTLTDTHAGMRVTIDVDRPATLWRHPVETVSISEAGFERIYQGSCLVFLFPCAGDLRAAFTLRVESI